MVEALVMVIAGWGKVWHGRGMEMSAGAGGLPLVATRPKRCENDVVVRDRPAGLGA